VVVTIVTRNQFAEHWNTVKPGLGDADSGLWAYERAYGPESQWFICIKPIRLSLYSANQQQFWAWCKRHCPSGVSCYSASDDEEWWGFVNSDEIMLWLLRWV
jgi:hypothetical protein